jgi:hypothetical protein
MSARRGFACALAAWAGVVACACAARGAVLDGSPLALSLMGSGPQPELVFAQRSIVRSWGLSEDTLYHEVEIPDWKSENGALALSAVVPGAGQVYAGQRTGLLFTLAEATLAFEGWYNRRRGRDVRDEAIRWAGSPDDSTSHFSFATYEQRTGLSADALRAIYVSDRALFYYLIARDDAWSEGWSDAGSGGVDRARFIGIRDDSEAHFRRSREFTGLLWVNHVAAALDALRAARTHNLPLRENLKLQLKSSWVPGHVGLRASLEGRF